MGLTLKRIAKLGIGRYHDKDGLYLKITPQGGSWLLRYQRDQHERWLGLGPLKDFDLDEARERARKARQQLRDGVDPIAVKREQQAVQRLEAARSVTFESAARQYFDQHEKKWSNDRHRQQFLNSLEQHVFPTLGALPVALVDTPAVLSVLEPIWTSMHVTAGRVRSRIEAVLDWCTVRGFRPGDPNPARWKGHLKLLLPAKGAIAKVAHHAALPFEQMPAFMVELAKRPELEARALEFLIMTAARSSEVLKASWQEVDLEAGTWTVPAERMKGRRGHRVALSSQAIKLLKALPREHGNEHVFIGSKTGRGLGDQQMWQLLKSMNVDATPHGMRAAFRTWASESTSYPREIIETTLAHVVGSAAERAYVRGDAIEKRRKLLQVWSDYIHAPARKAGDVVPINKKRGAS
jgi:integrase